MVKKFFKKKSKRVTTTRRINIEKKVKKHNKKLKRSAKDNPPKPKKKDTHIPNDAPFKDSILREAEVRKQKREDERAKQKLKSKREREKQQAKKRNLSSLAADAEKRAADFDRKNVFVAEEAKKFGQSKAVEGSLKAYYKEFRKVVEAADVVLQVLDARDPLGTRCPQVEQAVISAGTGKKLVLVLNKIDLVPKENVENWLKHLRNDFPTVAFKASTQSQRENLGRSNVALTSVSSSLLKSSQCLGADILLKLLGNYSRSKDIKTSITVGVVGFPNTGKSSLINSLKRSKACGVGCTPGFTKVMQEVQLDKHVKLLDSPGIVMATGNSDSAIILRNCVKVERLEDPVAPVEAILRRCNKQQIMMMYKLPDYSNVLEMLSLLAVRTGRLRKGGVPDINKAAKGILQDWNAGRITYYTHPPEQHTLPMHLDAKVVSEMSKEFDIEALLLEESHTLNELKSNLPEAMAIDAAGFTDCATAEVEEGIVEINGSDEDAENDDHLEEDDAADDDMIVGQVPPMPTSTLRSGGKKKLNVSVKTSRAADSGESQQLNKQRVKEVKKLKKSKRRADKKSEGSRSGSLNAAAASDSYDFNTDLK